MSNYTSLGIPRDRQKIKVEPLFGKSILFISLGMPRRVYFHTRDRQKIEAGPNIKFQECHAALKYDSAILFREK